MTTQTTNPLANPFYLAEKDSREAYRAKHSAAGLCMAPVKPSERVSWLRLRMCSRKAVDGQYCQQHLKARERKS